MKRHPKLLNLSREHHTALKLASDARRAADSGDSSEVKRMAGRVVCVFATELDPHFRVEEAGLLVWLAQTGERDLVQRTLKEHAELRNQARAVDLSTQSALRKFAELLVAHVRFEERELFEKAQNHFDAIEQDGDAGSMAFP